MILSDLKTNRMTKPLGFDLGCPRLSFIASDTGAPALARMRITVSKNPDLADPVCDSGWTDRIDTLAWPVPVELEPFTRYYWAVEAADTLGASARSETAWFETARMDRAWEAEWITPDLEPDIHPVVYRDFDVTTPVRRARVYASGLGVYELTLDGVKLGDECLMPGFNDYDSWIQYQTYDMDGVAPGRHRLAFELGNGWYKGRFGLGQRTGVYGDRFAAIAEIRIEYDNGEVEVIGTDRSWSAVRGPVVESGIYDGEMFDATASPGPEAGVRIAEIGTGRLQARLSPPITVQDRLQPVGVIRTPAGETVLDMGQNMVGWMEFRCAAPGGSRIVLSHGEILQDGNFYRDNLRTAAARFTYVSDGTARTVRPRFTFFGFRYVRVEGWPGPVDPADFTGCVIHSAMEDAGRVETSDPLVNRLLENVRWGQKGNFLDVPTDCPQRDERMGWTGDAQIFSGTACFNMDTYAFYTKYGRDLAYEQAKCGGSVPHVVPVAGYAGHGSTGWGEAATVIPWEVYLHFGDTEILRRQYDSMRGWVDWIRREDLRTGDRHLWIGGYHFGDWLALDGPVQGGVYGGTDPDFIASAYYAHSARLTAKAAAALGRTDDAAAYGALADAVRDAVRREYFTPEGRLAVDTQTAHALALYTDLVPPGAVQRAADRLAEKIRANGRHLDTGFVGTPYLCRVLSAHGHHELACDLLFNMDYPSWLYEVRMGATTIWERWNSVLPDGRISSTGMNSLNHYAYGSVAEWIYRYLAGIQPDEEGPGFTRVRLAPLPDYRFEHLDAAIKTPFGMLRSGWRFVEGQLRMSFEIPVGSVTEVRLPDAPADGIAAEDGPAPAWRREGGTAVAELPAGRYGFSYVPTRPYRKTWSVELPPAELMTEDRARAVIERHFKELGRNIPFMNESRRLSEVLRSPFVRVPEDRIRAMDRELRAL
ncbi:MAG: family 78 glycoside hydrolase catalytic domain [Clostridia bacterium]|nr:family 78 glycoside hydrolase catalytic domain [Clostridia bacterium]